MTLQQIFLKNGFFDYSRNEIDSSKVRVIFNICYSLLFFNYSDVRKLF